MEIPAIHFRMDGLRLMVGETGSSYSFYKRTLKLPGTGNLGHFQYAYLTVFLPDRHATVAAIRNSTVFTVGVVFVLFAMLIYWFLQKVITQPFIKMVKTARKCAGGSTHVRFDESSDDEFGFLSGFINEALDYTNQKQTEIEKALIRIRDSETALHVEKERIEVTLSSIADAVITADKNGNVDYMNPVAEKLTGFTLKSARHKPIDEIVRLIDEDTLEPVDNEFRACLEGGVVRRVSNAFLLSRDDKQIPISESVSPIHDSTSAMIGAVLVIHDEGRTRKLAKQLNFQASHDALTGLYNRHEFERRLKGALEDIKETGRHFALCYLDLDQFKVVNDTCGHMAGDELLRQLSTELQNQVRESDVIARLGGDEFGVLLAGCDLDHAKRVADGLRRTVSDYRFAYDGKSFEVGVSIGLVSIDDDVMTLSDLMSAADVACYAAKDSGRNRVHVYRPTDDDMKKRQGEMQWVSRIRQAIKDDRFCLFLQPIVPVDKEAGLKKHYEVLLRMTDEDGKTVPPMAFIPAAERYNLMPLIDRWVVKSVTESDGLVASSELGVIYTVNLSGQSLCDEKFLDYVITCFDESDIDAQQICFEITETAAITNLMRATRFINILRGTGCKFALDDFGSGLSSFGYLKTLHVDYLKIDGSFVRDMVDDPADFAMVEAINRIGHVMGIETIAEYVETEEIFNKLKEIGVDYGQGYWLGRPQPLEKAIETNLKPGKEQKASG